MLDNLKGELRIYTKVIEAKDTKRIIFNTAIAGTKGEDDKYINHYVSCNFSNAAKKVIKPCVKKECFDIQLQDGWFRVWKDKDNHSQIALFINKCKAIVNEDEEAPKAKKSKKEVKLTPVEDDEELPF